MNQVIESTDDRRVENSPLRHQYRVLSDEEKADVAALKDMGAEFLALLAALRAKVQPEPVAMPLANGEAIPLAAGVFTRELNIAAERIEEAVMWAVKHVTA